MTTDATLSRVGNIGLAVLAVCALMTTAVLIHREFAPPPKSEAGMRIVRERDWRRYAEGGTWIGPRDARIVLTEFSDFQCPFCRSLQASLSVLRQRYPTLAIVYRHYPLTAIHPFARAAATAAECAAAQGRFAEYDDALFARQDLLGTQPWTTLATAVGVKDTSAFAACVASDLPAKRIAADIADGDRLGIEGTPTVLVNDRKFMGGTPTLVQLDSVIRSLQSEK